MDRSWRKRVEPVESYSLKIGGEDPAQDVIVSGIDHHIVRILAEMLDRITQTGVAVKG